VFPDVASQQRGTSTASNTDLASKTMAAKKSDQSIASLTKMVEMLACTAESQEKSVQMMQSKQDSMMVQMQADQVSMRT